MGGPYRIYRSSMDQLNYILGEISGFVWGIPMVG
jgi:hypothetical protein